MDRTYGMNPGTTSYTAGAVVSSSFNAANASQGHMSNATFDPPDMTMTGLSDNHVAGPSTKRRQSDTSESSKKKRAAAISTGDLESEQAAQAKEKKKKASRACIHCQKVRASDIRMSAVFSSRILT